MHRTTTARARAAAAVLLLAALPALGAEPTAACTWKEPRDGLPRLESQPWRGVQLEWESPSTWYYCVRKGLKAEAKAAGRATGRTDGVEYPRVRFTWTDAKGVERSHEADVMDSHRVNETLGSDVLCRDGTGPKTVHAAIAAEGPWAPLAWKGGPVSFYCYRCQDYRSYEGSLGMIPERGGGFLLRGSEDAQWFACAKEDSTLELWMFAAPTRLEAQSLQEPTHKVQGLERSHRFERRIPTAALCKGGNRYLGFELHGTGDMTRLNGQRGVTELRCK